MVLSGREKYTSSKTQRVIGLAGQGCQRLDLALNDADELAGLQFTNEGGAHQVEGTGLGGDDDAVTEAREHERTEAAWIDDGVDLPSRADDQAVGTLGASEGLADLALHGRRPGAGDEVHQALGVGR